MPRLSYNLDEIKSYTVEPGRYRARLVKVEQTLSTTKRPMLVWHWKIVSGPEKGKAVRSFTSLLETALSGLKEHLEAFGLSGKVNMDTAKLIGRFVTLVIGMRSGTNRDGDEREYSTVLGVKSEKAEEDLEESEDVEDEEEEDEGDDEDESEDEDEEEDEDEDEDEEEEETPAPRRRSRTQPVSRARERRASKTKPAPAKKKSRRSDSIPF